MSRSYQIGVRLTDEQRDALERIAKETGLDLAVIVRHAADALIKHYERCGNRLAFPIDFSETIRLIKAGEETAKPNTKKPSQAA